MIPGACILGLTALIISLLLAAATCAQIEGFRQHDRDGGEGA